ncbi:hypothetical protein PBY51_014185 [Eleginops maclovinus]|uniref:Uncharacterized protein n=1 Tax=Eleginops maclovinus TaxID=56733 RepID=A0AAN7WKU3_ELEMC|nr:hypothetical protein PBY51_014185 [Eleginops maclovinus]
MCLLVREHKVDDPSTPCRGPPGGWLFSLGLWLLLPHLTPHVSPDSGVHGWMDGSSTMIPRGPWVSEAQHSSAHFLQWRCQSSTCSC